ncbi:MAG: type VI secretion system contractile sheath small subunit [Desulfobacterales bacterium]|nr:type VI secretion system contractile sheath small subunit [Desulfobacterales bacterium]MDD4073220.1 type VI secretion system contractile sheath small subunit [Desulfobacterales bacterium]MDD4393788.1 type VI secretion system contractile sheath small subunit [Desulfobacterales bacterium]
MAESTQHKLDRIRPPRVQITYDVEIGDAIQMKELPFVAGIMADLSGNPEKPLPKLKDRKFVEIDRDNFNGVLSAINPRLVCQVDNKLTNDGSKMNIELKFNHMDDFNPVNILKQVGPLKKLYDARQRLSDLLTKLDGNDDLDKLIQDVINNTENLNELKALSAAPEGNADPEPSPETPEPTE